jgi:hypothetical protein
MDENVLFLIVIYIVDVVLYIISFAWMIMCDKLKCKCVSEEKRNIIRAFITFLSFILVFSLVYISLTVYKEHYMLIYLKYFTMICQLIYIIILFSYLRDIIRKRCDCKKDSIHQKNYNNIDIWLMSLFLIIITYLTFVKLFF